jgi:UDP-N-acetylmuramoyl-tripeptide--D-alanyl-D-alanine ligase
MTMLDLDTAARALGASRSGVNAVFTGVTTDSRRIEPGDLFVALRGERYDGHAFADLALSSGAAAAMVEQGAPLRVADQPLILVSDTRRALGRLAAFWRGRFALPLAGVTGSNGKTTVKEMLTAILRATVGEDAVLATLGNLNNDIGVPLTLLRLRGQHRYAVIEMGMNHLGEISHLTQLARPTVALVTNAGAAHIGEVGSREAIARAKGEIYAGLDATGVALINADDDYAQLWRDLNRGRRVIEFGIDRPAAVSAQFELSATGTLVSVSTPGAAYVARLQVPGVHNVRNALAAAAAAHALGIAPAAVAAGLAAYAGSKGRLQHKTAHCGAVLIDDTYNANPDSVRAAIAVLAAAGGKRVLVLGDMGELGDAGPALHREIGEVARRAGVDHLFTLGELSEAATRAFGSGARHFQELGDLCSMLDRVLAQDTTVLVKGSRFMHMERVVERLVNDEPQPAQGGH